MKNFPNWLIVIIVIGALIASKLIFFAKKDDRAQGQNKGKAAAPPIAVNYYVVSQSEYANDVFATGKVGAMNQVDLLPEVSGKVMSVNFSEGQTVTKGSLLVELNNDDLQSQQSKLSAQVELAEKKLARLKKLLDIKGVSQEEFDMQQNELTSLQADKAVVIAQINKTRIKAPFDGVIGLKNISPGSFVNASTPIVSLVQMKPLYIEFSVPEKYSHLIKKGVNVSFATETIESTANYTAQVYAIEPRVDETTKTIRARALYTGSSELYPGSFVKVFVNFGNTLNALMVPTQCIIPTLKGQKLFLSKLGTATEVQVKTGVRTDKKIQVIEGLNIGDTVVTTGLLSVKKDSKLKLLKAVN